MHNQVRARAPGKVILIGEYAVLFGHQAYVMALPLYTTCVLSFQQEQGIKFELVNLDEYYHSSWNELADTVASIEHRYDAFLQGKCEIGNVLNRPAALLEYVLYQQLCNNQQRGYIVSVSSELSFKSGQGSSAALIISALKATQILRSDTISDKDLLKKAVLFESLQHGRSSGIDIAASFYGGALSYHKGLFQEINIPSVPLYIVETGIPCCTTGECVMHVQNSWSDEHNCIYEKVLQLFKNFLYEASTQSLKQAFSLNHRLLLSLNVVPQRVAEFIAAVEKGGGAAKISGSGALSGQSAGQVIVFGCDNLSQLAKDYKYTFYQLQGVDCSVTNI